jgi:heme-degrading monooxygenase HmoA
MSRDPQPSFTYQLRIVLRDVSPLIWRRLLVPSNIDLPRLSRILQFLFSWSGEHLHRLHIHGKDYGTAYAGGVSSGNDPLSRIPGFMSASILHRTIAEGIEFVIVTTWQSMDPIRQFTGDPVDVAVVPPAVQAMMVEYDTKVTHYEIVDIYQLT